MIVHDSSIADKNGRMLQILNYNSGYVVSVRLRDMHNKERFMYIYNPTSPKSSDYAIKEVIDYLNSCHIGSPYNCIQYFKSRDFVYLNQDELEGYFTVICISRAGGIYIMVKDNEKSAKFVTTDVMTRFYELFGMEIKAADTRYNVVVNFERTMNTGVVIKDMTYSVPIDGDDSVKRCMISVGTYEMTIDESPKDLRHVYRPKFEDYITSKHFLLSGMLSTEQHEYEENGLPLGIFRGI